MKMKTNRENLHLSLTSCEFESRLFKICNSLTKHKIFDKIHIICVHKGNIPLVEKLRDNVEIKRLKLYGVGPSILKHSLKYLQYTFHIIFFTRNKNIKVVNAHSLELLPIAILVKLIKKAKVVYDTHELETERTNLKGFRKKIAKFLERILIKFVDYVVVVNKSIEEEYKKMYPEIAKKNKIIAIYNVPPLIEVKASNIFRNKFNLKPQQKIFLYQGGFSYGRGIEKLLKVFSKLKDNNKVLVLMGYGPLEGLVKEYSRKYTNIFFHPAVSPDKLLEYTASADWGICFIESISLSYYLSAPNKFFEYLIAEIPVIVTPLKELKYFTETYNLGVVASGESEEDLLRAIQKTDGINIELLKENIRSFKKLYNWQNEERKLLNIYENLLKLNQ